MPASSNTTIPSESFLERGWLLALDSERVLIGWFDDAHEASDGVQLFAPDFYLQDSLNTSRRLTCSYQILERSHLRSWLEKAAPPDVIAPLRWHEPEQVDFNRQFQVIREGFRSHGLQKAVPVVFASAKAEMSREFHVHLLRNALAQPTHLYPYGVWDQTCGMTGVTPEILFSQTNEDDLQTVALAGTRRKTERADEDRRAIFDDPKERHEHQLVIDDIREVLSAIGEVTVGSTQVLELPTLFHLKTKLSCRLRSRNAFEDIARRLHPTPALGIAPRRLGFEAMKTWEPAIDRRRFGAPFGASYIDNGVEKRHCLVAIRNIQWQGQHVWLGSGCGIVPASDPEREWAELSLKRESVRRMLKI